MAAVAAAEAQHAPILGIYYDGRSTDWAQVSQALGLADTAVRASAGRTWPALACSSAGTLHHSRPSPRGERHHRGHERVALSP